MIPIAGNGICIRLRPIGHMPPSAPLTVEDLVGTGRQGAGSSRKEV
jgi:hypothetical protein